MGQTPGAGERIQFLSNDFINGFLSGQRREVGILNIMFQQEDGNLATVIGKLIDWGLEAEGGIFLEETTIRSDDTFSHRADYVVPKPSVTNIGVERKQTS